MIAERIPSAAVEKLKIKNREIPLIDEPHCVCTQFVLCCALLEYVCINVRCV